MGFMKGFNGSLQKEWNPNHESCLCCKAWPTTFRTSWNLGTSFMGPNTKTLKMKPGFHEISRFHLEFHGAKHTLRYYDLIILMVTGW